MSISRELMGKIVDEVFGGAIEDASVIEEIYAVIKRHEMDDRINEIIADDKPIDEGNIAIARRGIADGEVGLLALQPSTMTFTSDDEATEFLKLYGHEESQNGVMRGDWRSFDADCRAAVAYLCNEWDFIFIDTADPSHLNTKG